MDIWQAFETDAELCRDGLWIDIHEPSGKQVCSIKCRPADLSLNADYQAASVDLTLNAVGRNGDDQHALWAALYAETIITDWQGVTDRVGDELPCTPKNVKQLLTDLPIMFEQLRGKCRQWTFWRKKFVDEAVAD